MSPSDIEVLIHCHRTTDQHPRFEAPAVQEALAQFEADEVIERLNPAPNEGSYQTTERGKTLINILCSTPLPVLVWIDPRHGAVKKK